MNLLRAKRASATNQTDRIQTSSLHPSNPPLGLLAKLTAQLPRAIQAILTVESFLITNQTSSSFFLTNGKSRCLPRTSVPSKQDN